MPLTFTYFLVQGKVLCFGRLTKSLARCLFPKHSEHLVEKIISRLLISSNATLRFILRNIPYVIVRVDDILVSGGNDNDHLRNLEEVLKRLAEAELRLKKGKCVFMES